MPGKLSKSLAKPLAICSRLIVGDMMAHDLQLRDATGWLAAMAAGELTARDLLEKVIARIEAVNPSLNAVVVTDFAAARKAADVADKARAAGEVLGPLHGLPMTIKDALEVAGIVTTGGAPELKDHVPTAHADAVQRVVDAGAIIIGKTNVPYMSGDLQTYNDVYGTTNNPWDTGRTPGGSSGGAAASLAAGLTMIEIGSDIGGSIRCPAHYCGVAGHKPSLGLVSKRGHIPPPPGMVEEDDLSVVGPLARSVRDLELMLPILLGPSARDAKAWRVELPAARANQPKGMRLALWLDDPFATVSAATKKALNDLADGLEAAGAKVDRDPPLPTSLAETMKIYHPMLNAVVLSGLPDQMLEGLAERAKGSDPDSTDIDVLQARGADMRYRTHAIYQEMRAAYQAAWEAFFENYDAVLMPVSPDAAFEHNTDVSFAERVVPVDGADRAYIDFLKWAGPAILGRLPATVTRAGFSPQELPIGVQIMGPYLEDLTTLAVGRAVEGVTGGFHPPELV